MAAIPMGRDTQNFQGFQVNNGRGRGGFNDRGRGGPMKARGNVTTAIRWGILQEIAEPKCITSNSNLGMKQGTHATPAPTQRRPPIPTGTEYVLYPVGPTTRRADRNPVFTTGTRGQATLIEGPAGSREPIPSISKRHAIET